MQLKERFFKIGFLYRLIPLKFLMKLSSKKVVYPFYHHVMHDDDDKSLITSNLYQVKKKSEFLKDLKVIDKDIMGLLPEALHEKYGDGRKAQLFMGYTIVWIINISSTHANKLIGYCEIKGKEVFAVGVETYMKFFPKEWRDEDLKTYKEWRKLL